ncbi:MAG: response regulator [Asgard group archaeon]|nr:response regulator [Asgard group archaeon]
MKKIYRRIIKYTAASLIIVFLVIRYIYFDVVNEKFDATFFTLIAIAIAVVFLPWDRLQTIKAGIFEFTIRNPVIKGAIKSLDIDIIQNRKLKKELKILEEDIETIKGSRILWIDDRPLNIVGERNLLRSLGVIISFAVSSNNAESLLINDGDFDLIISDIQRLGDSYKFNEGVEIHEGINFIARIHTSKEYPESIKSIPVVFYAAYDKERLERFTRPAKETAKDKKLIFTGNSVVELLTSVITILSELRKKPVMLRETKTPTLPRSDEST